MTLEWSREKERRRSCLPSLFCLGCISEFGAICLVRDHGEKCRVGYSRVINLGLDVLDWSSLGKVQVAGGDSSLELWRDLWPKSLGSESHGSELKPCEQMTQGRGASPESH